MVSFFYDNEVFGDNNKVIIIGYDIEAFELWMVLIKVYVIYLFFITF